jgi:hypothetical protein
MTSPDDRPSSPGGTAELPERLAAVEAGIRDDRLAMPGTAVAPEPLRASPRNYGARAATLPRIILHRERGKEAYPQPCPTPRIHEIEMR